MSDTQQTETQPQTETDPAAQAAPQRQVRTPGRGPSPAQHQVPQPGASAALPEDMPNAIDIDPRRIKGPVLTRQGWVCPDVSGREPRGPR